jgi:methylated-DNA-protein-cysteine methyltransferase related protein
VRAVPAGWSVYYRIVRRVPRGKVTTYGAVAALAGKPRAARQVGFAMAALRGAKHDVPWHRVLGARTRAYGAISILDPMGAAVQRAKLEEEGIAFDDRGRVALARHGWPPPRAGQPSRRRAAPGGRPARKR